MLRHRRPTRRPIALAFLAVVSAACQGSATTATPQAPAAQGIDVRLTPATAAVATGGTVTFAASVTGTANVAVSWSVLEAGGGTIDASGRYTAPAAAGAYHVRATSVADPSATADAPVTVTVVPPVVVTISPRTPTVTAGGTVSFTATVANATDSGVIWSVAGTSCGTISQAGLYTAPTAARTCTVTATSRQAASSSDSATVSVTAAGAPVTVAVSPSSASVDACKTLQLTAAVANTTNGAVTWSVQEGAAGGSVGTTGVYTAPATAGTYHAVATSVADPSKSAVSTLTVSEKILSVSVTPTSATVTPGATAQFTATVTTTCGSFASASSLTVP